MCWTYCGSLRLLSWQGEIAEISQYMKLRTRNSKTGSFIRWLITAHCTALGFHGKFRGGITQRVRGWTSYIT
jgi:hypothetical protein